MPEHPTGTNRDEVNDQFLRALFAIQDLDDFLSRSFTDSYLRGMLDGAVAILEAAKETVIEEAANGK